MNIKAASYALFIIIFSVGLVLAMAFIPIVTKIVLGSMFALGLYLTYMALYLILKEKFK
jgi:hypothetical protein